MKIPFLKAHGAGNDFLLTWQNQLGAAGGALARAICDRHTGVGADGWIVISRVPDADAAIRLFNSDGSEAEISGNGTRCAAALLVHQGHDSPDVRIQTGAGVKRLRLIHRSGLDFVFEMNMGAPEFTADSLDLAPGAADVTLVQVGNPQCVVLVDHFDFDWRRMGAEIESHPRFPNRTNVSFVRRVDEHTIEARFFERGAAETMSSGTGATGAAAAAVRRGLVRSPVTVLTPAGPLQSRWNGEIYLTGPARIIAEGVFHYATMSQNE